jgi:hypothetical protein
VTSTLDGHASLPLRMHWQAFPTVATVDVSEVDFLIDGKLGWVEHQTPYVYGNDGNWLVTSFLAPGEHTFTVRAISTDGATATDTVRAVIAAPPGPPPPLGAVSWTRLVTSADVAKATSGHPPPPGRWFLSIGPVGWRLRDPTGGGLLFDVAYGLSGHLQMRPTIESPPYPNGNTGGFCNDTDPLWSWTYSAAHGGTTLTLRPVGNDPCGDRTAILAGTWTRTAR